MNYSNIDRFECLNGEGWGATLFVSGCDLYPACKNCQNLQARDFNYGKEFTTETLWELIDVLKNPNITRFTVCGGEPLAEFNIETVAMIIRNVREFVPDLEIWCYTGHTFEELKDKYKDDTYRLLGDIDVLIDGRYVEELSRPRPKYRGSWNQRVIDVQNTLKHGFIVEREVK